MSGSHHRHWTPGIVCVICSDPYHEGIRHEIGKLAMRREPDGTVRPRWLRGHMLAKDFRRADGLWTLWFPCECGRNPQRDETALTEIVRRLFAANPGATRVDLDITRLP